MEAESRFQFSSDLPEPDRFRYLPKTYPSSNPNRQTTIKKLHLNTPKNYADRASRKLPEKKPSGSPVSPSPLSFAIPEFPKKFASPVSPVCPKPESPACLKLESPDSPNPVSPVRPPTGLPSIPKPSLSQTPAIPKPYALTHLSENDVNNDKAFPPPVKIVLSPPQTPTKDRLPSPGVLLIPSPDAQSMMEFQLPPPPDFEPDEDSDDEESLATPPSPFNPSNHKSMSLEHSNNPKVNENEDFGINNRSATLPISKKPLRRQCGKMIHNRSLEI